MRREQVAKALNQNEMRVCIEGNEVSGGEAKGRCWSDEILVFGWKSDVRERWKSVHKATTSRESYCL